MQENKYFYQGMPLSQYCKENNLNVSTIRTRIWKLKNNKKNAQLTDEQIIDKVIKAYNTATQYTYKGKSLRQYCLDEEINYATIFSRIKKLKEKKPDLSNAELVTLAIEKFENDNYRFFYDGMPLKDYCELHPEINYNTIRGYINSEQEKNPNLTDEELIKQYIAKEHKGIYKFYYVGIPLIEYCFETNLNYKNIISYISRHKDDEDLKNLSDDELIAKIMDKYQPFEPKYLYKGMTLRAYCLKNNISYYSVVSYVKRKKAKGSPETTNNLIAEAINTINRYGIIYYYHGIPLKDYALEHNLNASAIRTTILRRKLKSSKSLQEIVDECVESYQKFSIKYYYNGVPLYTFCKEINLNYNTVIHKYLDEYSGLEDITIEEAIKQIVDYYLENPPISTKYYFNNISLRNFCTINGYSYLAILNRMKTLKNNNQDLNDNDLIETAIARYKDKLHINKINDIFNYLKSNQISNIPELQEICNFLKIDIECVNDLVNMDFSINQAVNIIWYFKDQTKNDLKIITDSKLKELFTLINSFETATLKDIEQYELYDLIGIYKSNLYDSRDIILKKQHRYLKSIIYNLCKAYSIKINNTDLEDFHSELSLYLIRIIDCTASNIYGQIIKYIDLSIKGYFRKYLKNYKYHNNMLSLDAPKYTKDRGDNTASKVSDFIVDQNNQDYEVENQSFSPNISEAISKLPHNDQLFIILKYQEDYTQIELSNHFNLTLEEVEETDIRILSFLKECLPQYGLKKTLVE